MAVAAVAASVMVPVASWAAGFSICAVGDSITQGGNTGFVAHRIALEQVLDANDWSVEWKGTRTDPTWGSSNPCEGYSGQNAQSVAANYVAHAASVVADVLLLHAGHNYNVDPDTTSPAYMPEADIVAAATNAHAQIIAAARAQNPNVIVLYAQVITSGKLPKYSYIPALNSGIAALAVELNTTASPVVAVDMADGWNYATDCVSDMVHPNAAGANKMAAKWFAALEAQVAAGKLTAVPKERAPVSVARDITLGKDTDWRGNGPVNIEPNATVNLNGHKLYVDGVSGGGAVFSARTGTDSIATDGYKLLAYVETPADNNTVKCHIDTGYIPAATDRVEAGFQLGTTDGTQWIFGSYTANKRFDCYISNGKCAFMLGNKNATKGAVLAQHNIALDGARSHAVLRKEYYKTETFEIDENNFTPTTPIRLFGAADNTANRWAISCRLHFFRIYDKDGSLRLNLLPAQNANGVVGLFDTVRKVFFVPANGALTAGESNEYEEREYVETSANNASAFVDTRYWPSPSDRVETRIRFSSLSGNMGIFSARYTYQNRPFNCILRDSNGISFDHYKSGTAYAYHTVGGVRTRYTTGTDYDLVMDGGTCQFSVNGTVSETRLGDDMDEAYTNFVLFATADGYDKRVATFAKGLRMYGFKVYNADGYITADLVPARRTSDSAIGFYDRIRNYFLTTPDGTATLSAGSVSIRQYGDVRDLTHPGGTCAMPTPHETSSGTVDNLFNDNFIYRTDATHRVLLNSGIAGQQFPLRIDYDFGEGEAKTVNMYRVHAAYHPRAPKAWVFYGSNDPAAYNSASDDGWVVIDECESQLDWETPTGSGMLAQYCTKVFANDAAYRFYRMKITEKKDETQSYFDLVQLEYFRVEPTGAPGELHVDVAVGKAVTNATVTIGGDMKVVKEGGGSFTAEKADQFYMGGTEVNAGTFTVAAPLSTVLTMVSGATLGFVPVDGGNAPLLALESGSSIPSPLNVSVFGDARPPQDGFLLASGYNFSGVALNPVELSENVTSVMADGEGDLRAYRHRGFMIIVR